MSFSGEVVFVMKLYLARHAESQELLPDHSPELSAEGVRHANCVARFLRDGGAFQPSEIWHDGSPSALQTATIYRDVAAWESHLFSRSDLAGEAATDSCYEEICRRDKSLAIVGRKHYLQTLFSRMIGTNNAGMLDLVHGGVICLSRADYYCGVGRTVRRWSLAWLLNPEMFEIKDTRRVS